MEAQLFILFPEQSGVNTTIPSVDTEKVLDKFVSQMSNTLRWFERVCQVEEFTYYYIPSNAQNFKSAFVKDKKNLTLLRKLLDGVQKWDNGLRVMSGFVPRVAVYGKSTTQHTISVVCGGDSISMDMIPLNLYAMYEWMSEHREPQRIYLWNAKHGEYGKHLMSHRGENVSPLLSSKEEAAVLLPYAIGLRSIRKLYAFDYSKDLFEEFMPGAGNYHSYHLQNINLVPKSIQIHWGALEKSRI